MADESEINFQFVAENSTDIICRCGMNRVLHYVSPSCFRTLGWKPLEMIGKPVDEFVFSQDFPFLAAAIAVGSESVTIRMVKKDGSTASIENRVHLVHDATGRRIEWIVVMRETKESKEVGRMALGTGAY